MFHRDHARCRYPLFPIYLHLIHHFVVQMRFSANLDRHRQSVYGCRPQIRHLGPVRQIHLQIRLHDHDVHLDRDDDQIQYVEVLRVLGLLFVTHR